MPKRKSRGRKAASGRKSAATKRKTTRKKAPVKAKKEAKKRASVRAKRSAPSRKKPAKKSAKRRVAVKKSARRKKRGRATKAKASSGVPLYLLAVDLENVRCFGPKQTLLLSTERAQPIPWTVVFGDNGSGKSTLLQAVCSVASTLQDRKEVPSFIRYNWSPKRRPSKATIVGAKVLLRPREVAEFSVRYAPDRRRQSPPPGWDFNRDGTLNYFGYGASRRYGNTADSGRKPLESSGDESLFVDEAELLNAEEWFV